MAGRIDYEAGSAPMKGGKNAMGIVITVLIFGLIGWVEGAHLWRDVSPAGRRDVRHLPIPWVDLGVSRRSESTAAERRCVD